MVCEALKTLNHPNLPTLFILDGLRTYRGVQDQQFIERMAGDGPSGEIMRLVAECMETV